MKCKDPQCTGVHGHRKAGYYDQLCPAAARRKQDSDQRYYYSITTRYVTAELLQVHGGRHEVCDAQQYSGEAGSIGYAQGLA